MANVTIVVGLPGSGKSHMIRRLKESCKGVCEEDFQANSYGDSPNVTASKHYAALIKDLRNGLDCAIADVAFTDTWRREELEKVIRADVADVNINWLFYANDIDRCIANIRYRARSDQIRSESEARHLTTRYNLPQHVVVYPVWEPPADAKQAENSDTGASGA